MSPPPLGDQISIWLFSKELINTIKMKSSYITTVDNSKQNYGFFPFFFLLFTYSSESIALGSNLRNGNFNDEFARFEVALSLIRVCSWFVFALHGWSLCVLSK